MQRTRLILSWILSLVIMAGGGYLVFRFYSAEPSPREVIAAIERQAGPSDAPPGSRIKKMPYSLPVSANITPVQMPHGYQLYYDRVQDLVVAVRPMRGGVVQTLMYLYGDKAPSSYDFAVELLPKTNLKRNQDGSISVVDQRTGHKYRTVEVPREVGLGSRNTQLSTALTTKGNIVTQTIELKGAHFPILADPEFDDPLTQLIEGRVPDLSEINASANQDGPSHKIGPYGRYYYGPNGLEIRLNNRGTLLALSEEAGLARMATEFAGISKIAKNRLNQLGNKASFIVGGVVFGSEFLASGLNDVLSNDTLKNFCIGITVSRSSVLEIAEAVMKGVINPNSIALNTSSNFKAWSEPCDDSRPLFSESQPSSEPAKSPEKEAKAEPLPEPVSTQVQSPVQPSQEADSTTEEISKAHGSTDHTIDDMSEACRNGYGNDDYVAQVGDQADPNSWYCQDGEGNNVGPVDIQGNYCEVHWPGSEAVPVEDHAYGWRCRRQE